MIGATEKTGSVGRTVLWNLISSPFGGTVYPVNPSGRMCSGIKAYPDVAAVPEPVDLAVIVTPAPTVPGGDRRVCRGRRQGGDHHLGRIQGDRTPTGVELERQMVRAGARGQDAHDRPELPGRDAPARGLNATFASPMARPGNVGFLSQSGALCTAILDWSLREKVGFSAFVSRSARCSTSAGAT